MNTVLKRPVVVELCQEPEGDFVRKVSLAQISFERLAFYYEKMKDFGVLFNDFIGNNPEAFFKSFVELDDTGRPMLKGLVWEVDDVGIIYLTNLIPEFEAEVHASFWDRRFRGRERLFLECIRYFMEAFDLHRIYMEIPLYAQPAMGAIERVGFKKEGRKRQAIPYKGKWFDVNLYSLLRDEVEQLCQ